MRSRNGRAARPGRVLSDAAARLPSALAGQGQDLIVDRAGLRGRRGLDAQRAAARRVRYTSSTKLTTARPSARLTPTQTRMRASAAAAAGCSPACSAATRRR